MLTNQEFEIYMLIVGRGWGDTRIAHHLFLTRQQVRTHVEHILDKLGASSPWELLTEYWKKELQP